MVRERHQFRSAREDARTGSGAGAAVPQPGHAAHASAVVRRRGVAAVGWPAARIRGARGEAR